MSRRRRTRSRPPAEQADVEQLVTHAYERHAGAIAAYALRRAAPADAADVVADTFLVAWRRHVEIPDEPDTLPWLYGVARRVLANQRRSRDRRTRLHDRLRTEFIEFDTRVDRVEDTERFQRVASALACLSDDDAELLRLTAWEGLTPTEIATAIGLEPSAVRQRLRRARQRLRHRLAADGPDVAGRDPAGQRGPGAHRLPVSHEPRWSAGGGS
ncbi:MAG: sigma-70 family RNA polymerase sigma factor [Ilumatobacter sp.]|uniref:sigma-70 family RNA polymerase sigma factor n=1 Tax=Ilumatobacter sp. TaxID=1967498 RepID=UPI00262B0511|nr:sigma-70 family RNA polymerase sigma factor [Ilumatobacter sp.]MDJ0770360.1 sigma-70 family RNA polymerase sigma factor [Ilumatobacter sp.]